jgi:hypothetical protein
MIEKDLNDIKDIISKYTPDNPNKVLSYQNKKKVAYMKKSSNSFLTSIREALLAVQLLFYSPNKFKQNNALKSCVELLQQALFAKQDEAASKTNAQKLLLWSIYNYKKLTTQSEVYLEKLYWNPYKIVELTTKKTELFSTLLYDINKEDVLLEKLNRVKPDTDLDDTIDKDLF